MHWKKSGTVKILLLAAILLLALGMAQGSEAQPDVERRLLERVAEREGVPAAGLSVTTVEEAQLPLTGRALQRAKVIDRASGEVYAITVDESGATVDLERAEARERAAYEQRYGSLHPELYAQLQAMGEEETVTVAIWLKAPDLRALPRPAVGHEMARTEAGNDRSPARTFRAAGEGAPEEKVDDAGAARVPADPDGAETRALIEEAEAANGDHLAEQVRAVQAPFLEALSDTGAEAAYTSGRTPLVYAELSRSQIMALAGRDDVDTIYRSSRNFDLMESAKPTVKADVVENWGFEGAGVSVAILEDSRVEFDNPYLALGGSSESDTVRLPGDSNVDEHAAATAGIVASQDGIEEGIAQEASLYSANATSYSDSDLSDAMDWAVGKNMDIINNSWGGNAGSDSLNVHDRHLDYIVRNEADTVVVAAGNEAGPCASQTGRVLSPARGYNVISVGGIDDANTSSWADDAMYICSSFVDPSTGVQKPEVVAGGVDVSSTTDDSTEWVADVGTETSYAAPMVSGQAALLLDGDGALSAYPETVKAAIMATALHNIEGDSELSDQDGAGGIDARAAFHLADEGWWEWDNVQESDFPYTYTQHAYAGETVRAAIAWNSNPTSDYSSDPLEADLDLRVYDGDGNFVSSSTSFDNSFEIVEFEVPQTGNYQFRISEFRFDGSAEFVGFAFWPGYRTLTPQNPATYDTPPVSQDYYRITAADNWQAAGIRMPSGHDYDIALYDQGAFGDPAEHVWLEDSTLGGDSVDFVVLDGNHAPPEDYFLETEAYSGSSGTYDIEWATQTAAAPDGTYGPYTMAPDQVLRVWDVPFASGEAKRILARPVSGDVDLGLALFATDGGNSTTWYQGRSQAVSEADDDGPAGDELLAYSAAGNDEYGLVAWSNGATQSGDFMLYVDSTPPAGTMDVDGGATYANSSAVTLNNSVSDAETGVSEMRFSNDGSTWSSWEAYNSSKGWTLSSGEGSRTVYAEFRNTVTMTTRLSDSITVDTTNPTGVIQVDGGASYATSTSVALSLSASDATSGVAEMRFSNDGSSWSAWETYANSKSWTLSSGDGSKTVYVQYRDGAGNVSAAVTDTISLDTVAPSASASSPAETRSLSFNVTWSGNDATAGIDSYDVQYRVGSGGTWTEWLTDTSDTTAVFGPDGPVTVQRDQTYSFRVRARDNAGNVSAYASGDGDTSTRVEAYRLYLPGVIG